MLGEGKENRMGVLGERRKLNGNVLGEKGNGWEGIGRGKAN